MPILNLIWSVLDLVLAFMFVTAGLYLDEIHKPSEDGAGVGFFGIVLSWLALACTYPLYGPWVNWLSSTLPQRHTLIHYFTVGVLLGIAFILYELIVIFLSYVVSQQLARRHQRQSTMDTKKM